jgi:hypothetical protein
MNWVVPTDTWTYVIANTRVALAISIPRGPEASASSIVRETTAIDSLS